METGLTPRPRFSYGDAMQKPVHHITFYIILSASIFLCSCTGKVTTLRILTDRKELTSAAEIYNSTDENVIVTIHNVSMIDNEVIKNENPDLVIGSFLSSSEIIDLFRPSEAVFPVYETLSGPLDSKGRHFLTPLSFELPLIMGLKETMSLLPDTMLVQPGELREAAAPYTAENNDGRLIRLGFSPTWSPQFLTDLLALRAPDIFASGMKNSEDTQLTRIVEETQAWISESAGDTAADTAFNNRYRYIPDEYLIIDGRILFARTDFDYWSTLPDTITGALDLRYLSGPRKIPVIKVTSAGIPLKASSPAAASAFIKWLMLPETQSLLMDRWERDGIDVFGFLGGLSSLREVNETYLRSMIPEGHYLQVPESRPLRWSRIREEVIIPWFQSALSTSSTEPTLTEAYRKWDLSSLAEGE